VSQTTGRDVADLCAKDDETLRSTENAQLALYTCGVAAAAAVREKGIEPSFAAGHSVGEYAALAAAGVLGVEDGAKLVALRGKLMSEAQGGTMAAVLGLEEQGLENLCFKAAGTVVIANYNCPGQVVISGEPAAVAEVAEAATAAGARRVLPLNVSGAFHSPLMSDASDRMREALSSIAFHETPIRVPSNVTGTFPATSDWPDLLAKQIASPVRWVACMQTLLAAGAARFIECGVGNVLCGLMRRIDKEAECVSVEDAETLNSM